MIGIYDSGIGGLGIFQAIRNLLPNESIHYFGDTAYFPFGKRSAQEVQTITLKALQTLAKTCNSIVIACNTASVNDLDYYRSQVNVPVIGVVPVIKTAAQLTQNNTISLLATPVTIASPYTDTLIKEFAQNKHVNKVGCLELADAIESGTVNDELLNKYLQPNTADVIVLGCTHYTLIKGQIQRLVGPDVKVIDSNEAVARQTLRVLELKNLFQPTTNPNYIFECSGDRSKFLEQVHRYTNIIVK